MGLSTLVGALLLASRPTFAQGVVITDPLPQADARFGNDVLAVDLDQDGNTEMVVASPNYTFNASTNAGCVVIGRGPITSVGTPVGWVRMQEPTGANTSSQFGYRLATGDYNGDGYPDLAVSAPGRDVDNPIGTWDQGLVWVLFGPWNFSNLTPYSLAVPIREETFTPGGTPTSQRFNNPNPPFNDAHGDRFGERIATANFHDAPAGSPGAGDELLIGSPFSSVVIPGTFNRYKNRGQAYAVVFNASPSSGVSEESEIVCPVSGNNYYFGCDVAAGNLTVDSTLNPVDEVVVGEPGAPASASSSTYPNAGRVSVYNDYLNTRFTGTSQPMTNFIADQITPVNRMYHLGTASTEGLFFGFKLTVGYATQNYGQNGYDTLFVGAPRIARPTSAGGNLKDGAVFFLPGSGTFPNNPGNFWFDPGTITATPPLASVGNGLDHFGGGLTLVNRGNNSTPGQNDTYDFAVAAPWWDLNSAAPGTKHGEGEAWIFDVSTSTPSLSSSDIYDDSTPEELLKPIPADPDEDEFERPGFGNVSTFAGPMRGAGFVKESLLIGNATATVGTMAKAGEVHLFFP